MREIKFRIRGDEKGTWHIFGVYIGKPNVATIPETLGQYTGLKDKNGVEIYEGDIVHVNNYVEGDGDKTKHNTQVVFGEAEFYLSEKYHSYEDLAHLNVNGVVEVVGNIYENPELLK